LGQKKKGNVAGQMAKFSWAISMGGGRKYAK